MPPVTRSQRYSLVPRAHERGTIAVIVDDINWQSHEFLEVQPEADNIEVRRFSVEIDQEVNIGAVPILTPSS